MCSGSAGLAENRCLQRTDGGARLLQIGEQDVAMGIKFRARVVLDIGEHMNGVRPQLLSDERVRTAMPAQFEPLTLGVHVVFAIT